MIKEIKIENFKSIESLNLELGRLNVFIGANGSGKSNILEGIALGSVAVEQKLDTEFLYARGIRVGDDVYMPSAFEKNNTKSVIIIFSENHTPISVEINKDGWKVEAGEQINLADFLEDTKPLNNIISAKSGRFNEQSNLFPFIIYAPENTYLRNFIEEGQIKPMGFRGEGLFKLLQKIIQKKPEYFQKINEHLQLLDWFNGFEIPNDLMFTERRIKIKDQFLEDGVQYIDQRSANEGFLYLLFYLTLFISDETPKFFAIDNIDNAMNPKLGSELIKVLSKLAKEHDKQTILTTHNPSVLDGLDLSDDEQRLFVISRNKSGHTQAIRVPYKESDERLSTRFIRGAIGGLPKNF
jgi:AAA15 family ATPase/GTPase